MRIVARLGLALVVVVVVWVVAVGAGPDDRDAGTSASGRGGDAAVAPVDEGPAAHAPAPTVAPSASTSAPGAARATDGPPSGAPSSDAVVVDLRMLDRWSAMGGDDGFLGAPEATAACTPSDVDATRCVQRFAGGTLVWTVDDGAHLAAADDASGPLVVVNKARPLHPRDYAPRVVEVSGGQSLSTAVAPAAKTLLAAARKADLPMTVRSGYRSYADQKDAYRKWSATLGDDEADRESARPGFSEHQTGLALDLLPADGPCDAFGCFAGTPEARWLAQNAYRYGFVVRYPKGAEATTGYVYEPWHLRYVGRDVAVTMRAQHATVLETFLGLPAAPDYP
ncbi:M15 family metallopeptidase [Cellulomonas sp. PhB143]|uniref:M15 family metallopeptidase n=1 Tax=Cellulomonas sp. PhB143 TaxID=2485186 RepID=UPI0011CEC75D|nr:M15 family metallopeptidase [Cellulomonas sp. PhB143]